MMLEELQKYVTLDNMFALYPFVCVLAVAWCVYRKKNLYEGIAEGLGKYATFYAIFCHVTLLFFVELKYGIEGNREIITNIYTAFGFYIICDFFDALKGIIYFFRIKYKKKKAGLWLCAFFVLLVYIQSLLYIAININSIS
ncbi:MAG: hypothetical protein EAZ74_05220 [Alphaproteobacteria bacterium]|nr:MAG: hypothetical protein EAY76_03840 [Alphaproteobacteria bacterium]TAF13707.1 MAG: hypothetical protein EAZ74_05220 [Alphaproteobacteria bacterium]TAF76254.1 MAG: hypothetical protein EAZ52_04190 [Alphaproteobacteria bacterium]